MRRRSVRQPAKPCLVAFCSGLAGDFPGSFPWPRLLQLAFLHRVLRSFWRRCWPGCFCTTSGPTVAGSGLAGCGQAGRALASASSLHGDRAAMQGSVGIHVLSTRNLADRRRARKRVPTDHPPLVVRSDPTLPLLRRRPPGSCPISESGHCPLRHPPGRAVRPDGYLLTVMVQRQADGWRELLRPPHRPSLGQRPGLHGTVPDEQRPWSAVLSTRLMRICSRSARLASPAPVEARLTVRFGPGAVLHLHVVRSCHALGDRPLRVRSGDWVSFVGWRTPDFP